MPGLIPPTVLLPAPGYSILWSPVQPRTIPLNTKAIEALSVGGDSTQSKTSEQWEGVTFASIAIFHKDPMVEPGINVYDCLKKVFDLLLRTNPRTTILPL